MLVNNFILFTVFQAIYLTDSIMWMNTAFRHTQWKNSVILCARDNSAHYVLCTMALRFSQMCLTSLLILDTLSSLGTHVHHLVQVVVILIFFITCKECLTQGTELQTCQSYTSKKLQAIFLLRIVVTQLQMKKQICILEVAHLAIFFV